MDAYLRYKLIMEQGHRLSISIAFNILSVEHCYKVACKSMFNGYPWECINRQYTN